MNIIIHTHTHIVLLAASLFISYNQIHLSITLVYYLEPFFVYKVILYLFVDIWVCYDSYYYYSSNAELHHLDKHLITEIYLSNQIVKKIIIILVKLNISLFLIGAVYSQCAVSHKLQIRDICVQMQCMDFLCYIKTVAPAAVTVMWMLGAEHTLVLRLMFQKELGAPQNQAVGGTERLDLKLYSTFSAYIKQLH